MLPVIEDIVLAQRAMEGRFTVQELLLYSSVSGTGLDVAKFPELWLYKPLPVMAKT
jgi:uncharacterized protein (UPF0210 family)